MLVKTSGNRSSVDNERPEGELPLELRGTRIGAMVPKRWAKRAVTRNAIKRQIYSVSEHAAQFFQEAGYVVRLRRTFDRATFISASSKQLTAAVHCELVLLFNVLRTNA